MEFDLAGVKKKLLLIIAAASILIGTVAVWGLKINPQDSELLFSDATDTNRKADENMDSKGKAKETAQEATRETANGRNSEGNNGTQTEVYVHVVGAVLKPSLYKMKEGQRVYDIVLLAKPTKQADLEQVNLAEKLVDGTQIVIPLKGTKLNITTNGSTGSGSSRSSKAAQSKRASGKININYAGVEELDQLQGVGPALAQKIIDYRKANGRFKTIDELNNVPGIGDKKLQSIRQNITL